MGENGTVKLYLGAETKYVGEYSSTEDYDLHTISCADTDTPLLAFRRCCWPLQRCVLHACPLSVALPTQPATKLALGASHAAGVLPGFRLLLSAAASPAGASSHSHLSLGIRSSDLCTLAHCC